jgi:phosphopentomutase
MGGDVSGVRLESLATGLETYRRALAEQGHDARPLDGRPVLVVDDAMLVHDSLEADPGMNYNVTGSLDAASFEEICAVARIVRELAPVPRVIAVGAHDTSPGHIFGGVHERDGAVGIDTPGLGIYERGAEILHFGRADLTGDRQLPTLAAAAGLPVTLVGKMADIVSCDPARRLPAVETRLVLSLLRDAVAEQPTGLIAANVQELDLAGHRASPEEYVSVLEQSDAALAQLTPRLTEDDLMLITGDHGNDPTMGAMHTREAVPILAYAPAGRTGRIGVRATLADMGATLADWLGLPPTASGDSFLELVR